MNLSYLGLGNAVLNITPKAQATKEKIDKLDFMKMCIKGHHPESEKATHSWKYLQIIYLIRSW